MSNAATFDADRLGHVLSGICDCLFAVVIALEQRGLLRRVELVAVLTEVIAQASQQEGGRTERVLIAEMMLAAFDAPVAGADARSRLKVVPGGRDYSGEPAR